MFSDSGIEHINNRTAEMDCIITGSINHFMLFGPGCWRSELVQPLELADIKAEAYERWWAQRPDDIEVVLARTRDVQDLVKNEHMPKIHIGMLDNAWSLSLTTQRWVLTTLGQGS